MVVYHISKFLAYIILLVTIQGVVRVGAVNADEHKTLGGQYGIRGFPTIKIFGSNKNLARMTRVSTTINKIISIV